MDGDAAGPVLNAGEGGTRGVEARLESRGGGEMKLPLPGEEVRCSLPSRCIEAGLGDASPADEDDAQTRFVGDSGTFDSELCLGGGSASKAGSTGGTGLRDRLLLFLCPLPPERCERIELAALPGVCGESDPVVAVRSVTRAVGMETGGGGGARLPLPPLAKLRRFIVSSGPRLDRWVSRSRLDGSSCCSPSLSAVGVSSSRSTLTLRSESPMLKPSPASPPASPPASAPRTPDTVDGAVNADVRGDDSGESWVYANTVLIGRSESRLRESRLPCPSKSRLSECCRLGSRSAMLLRAEKNAPDPVRELALLGLVGGSWLTRGDVRGLPTMGEESREPPGLSACASDASRTAAGTGGSEGE